MYFRLLFDNLQESDQYRQNEMELRYDWLNPSPNPELYKNFEENHFNIAIMGQSGSGKSSFVKTVTYQFFVFAERTFIFVSFFSFSTFAMV